jgi:hypothetical protein
MSWLKKLLGGLLLVLVMIQATGCDGIQGNGVAKSEKRTVDTFTKIELGGAFSADVTMGKETSLEIKGDENLLPFIKTEVIDGVLKIYNLERLSPQTTLKATVVCSSLNEITLSGAGDIHLSGLHEESLHLVISGAGKMTAAGECKNFSMRLSGAGSLEGKELKTTIAKVHLSGTGKAALFVSEELEAKVSGIGSIDYYGNPPKVNPIVSGIGTINKR